VPRGIDCPDLSTLAGRKARRFVEDKLAQFVVIRTFRTDNFGRYLIDLRYLPGEDDPEVVRTNGIFLNRQLLDQHLAIRFGNVRHGVARRAKGGLRISEG